MTSPSRSGPGAPQRRSDSPVVGKARPKVLLRHRLLLESPGIVPMGTYSHMNAGCQSFCPPPPVSSSVLGLLTYYGAS